MYQLDSETNSEFEFQVHLVLLLAMHGVAKLSEGQYCFMTSAGPVLVRDLALANYRGAQGFIIDHLNALITKYFNGLVTWKATADLPIRGDLDKLYLLDINETYIAYKYSNIKNKKFPERAFESGSAGRIAARLPARDQQ